MHPHHIHYVNENGSLPRRASSCIPNVPAKAIPRRNSFAAELNVVIQRQQSMAVDDEEEVCSTCSSSDGENDGDGEDEGGSQDEQDEDEAQPEEEKEIFIDFKPRLSPSPPSKPSKKKLLKTKSDGEILVEKKKTEKDEPICRVSASEEDLKTPVSKTMNFSYRHSPIKDEGICLSPREKAKAAFRKRSISLEDPSLEPPLPKPSAFLAKSAPPTPPLEDLPLPEFPSMDSLATNDARSHSDTMNWNESQTTIIT